MKRLLTLFAVLGLLTCGTRVANAVVLIGGSVNNGDFDATYAQEINPPAPGFFLAKPTVWDNIGTRTITGPYEDESSAEPWAGPAPTPVTTDGNGLPEPDGCSGGLDCGVFFKPFSGNATDGLANGTLQQKVPGTPGLTYQLSGWAGAEANALMQGAEIAIDFLNSSNGVISSSTINLLPTLFVPNGQPFNYKLYITNAVAPAGTAFVQARASMIGAVSNPAGGGQAFVVDDFTLQSFVPEPASVSLVMLGVLGLFGMVRRR
jgi:hypothetical protein